MAARLLPLLPIGSVYVEPFGGAANLLAARPPAGLEIYNDLDEDMVNLFRVLQRPMAFRLLRRRLRFTSWSRAEFARALRLIRSPSDLDRAWAWFVLCNQGFAGHRATCVGNWGRERSARAGGPKALTFRSRVRRLLAIVRRFARVQIEQRDAFRCIRDYDTPETVFYLDPPYCLGTRCASARSAYIHELTDDQHRGMVNLLLGVRGAVALSGYASRLYEPLTDAGWRLTRWRVSCMAMHPSFRTPRSMRRVECLWRNQRCTGMLTQERDGCR